MMLVLPSCIVAEPPEYKEAVRTVPFLDSLSAQPLTEKILVVSTKDLVPVGINVPVRSEDAGEELYVRFFLDYGVPAAELPLLGQQLSPSTYDDTSRAATLNWVVRPATSAGCHRLTLVVAHKSSFKGMDVDHLDPAKLSEAAILNWWVNVDPPFENLNTLINCPIASRPGL